MRSANFLLLGLQPQVFEAYAEHRVIRVYRSDLVVRRRAGDCGPLYRDVGKGSIFHAQCRTGLAEVRRPRRAGGLNKVLGNSCSRVSPLQDLKLLRRIASTWLRVYLFLGFTWLVSQRSLQVFLGERSGFAFRFM